MLGAPSLPPNFNTSAGFNSTLINFLKIAPEPVLLMKYRFVTRSPRMSTVEPNWLRIAASMRRFFSCGVRPGGS